MKSCLIFLTCSLLLSACLAPRYEKDAFENKKDIELSGVVHRVMKLENEEGYTAVVMNPKNFLVQFRIEPQLLANNVEAIQIASGCKVVTTSIFHKSVITTAAVDCSPE